MTHALSQNHVPILQSHRRQFRDNCRAIVRRDARKCCRSCRKSTSAEQRQELGQDHRGRAPDLDAGDAERRHASAAKPSRSRSVVTKCAGSAGRRRPTSRIRATSSSAGVRRGPRRARRDDRMQPEPADRNVERRQRDRARARRRAASADSPRAPRAAPPARTSRPDRRRRPAATPVRRGAPRRG